jgi:hypothetical protein
MKLPCYSYCLVVVLFALLSIICNTRAQVPSSVPVPPPNPIDPCLAFSVCSQCVADSRCLWCLSASSHPCRSRSYCPLTGYSDCCVLLKTCSSCKEWPSCGFCGDTNLCIPGNVTTPKGTTCKAWYFDKCPDPNKNPNLPVILVIMLTVGSGVVILSIVLLVLFIRRLMRQNRARKDMKEYYQPSRAVCDFCQDGLATIICKQCKLNLCDHCMNSDDLHPAGVNHSFEAIEYTVQDDLTEDQHQHQPLRQEDAYTSFAGLLSNKGSHNSYQSFGSH